MAENLKFYADGKELNYWDRIHQEGEKFYKKIGQVTWRVPPVKFNCMVTKPVNSGCNCKIVVTPQETDQETNCAENIVCGTFENLSNNLVEAKETSAMFIVSNFEYDNYLNKIYSLQLGELNGQLLNLPKDVASRGELDILILHQEAGILLVQTKAVGYNIPKNAEADCEKYISNIERAVMKAVEQLERDVKVMLHVMGDLKIQKQQITKVVALPNLSRSFLDLAVQKWTEKCTSLGEKISNSDLQLKIHFLCQEHFKCPKALKDWWCENFSKKTGITLNVMKQIAYRTVGLLSTVSVWTSSQPRMEVRNLNDAAWETGNRFTQVLLSGQQAELLKRQEKYFYVWGPAGSGKTLLLSLKGHQWLRKHPVAILNTRLGSKGRTVGHVMESTINKTIENTDNKKCKMNKAMRIDIDLAENEQDIEREVANIKKQDPTIRPMFLIDEVTWLPETAKLITILMKQFPHSHIWCAGMLPECRPEGFESQELLSILRCPPSVQRVLRIVDNRTERRLLYHLDSSKAGLPTDGPPPYFIIHSKHGSPDVQPYDCVRCAELLSDFLLNTLNLKMSLPSHDGAQSDAASQSKVEGCRLHFNDAVLAVSMPRSWHHYTNRGYWAISREALHSNMMFLGSGPFCQTLLDRQIPLKVEGAMTFTPEKNVAGQTFAMCPIGSVHGLEYKVVVGIPSARKLTKYTEINEGIIKGDHGPRVPMKRLPFAKEIKRKRDELLRQGPEFCTCFLKDGAVKKRSRTLSTADVQPNEPKSDKIRISTHVHGNYRKGHSLPDDLLYENCDHLNGTMDSPVADKQLHLSDSEKHDPEVDSDDHTECLDRLKNEVCGYCNTENCVCKYCQPEELVALHKLDQWDKAYILMCASRCTSQLILVLP
ncbi:uncharacterized protein LOC106052516 [Biomphalaria glabrata]|uniref:Uncharacterized protein LOC106052516 n=1 Tax=Biomphalaria glabrata TaxID=6526 RepID=A0A9W2YWK8_BIOGL|nr:uncharacterized protein LOC106052516 [Biomphalaria glabrata]XP_055867030.1 uncharacterized protein LOC106052516 [Biomphalaria glabrata]XP_055867031.1 uncharacterized protein LOC106052516 [Biomphalaria glabrata]KAI8734696.1 hypothetical protein BgiMline_028010 [Biomphalaria glabrata]